MGCAFPRNFPQFGISNRSVNPVHTLVVPAKTTNIA
jgi:hypothetical protein